MEELGFAFVNLGFVGAAIATVAFFFAFRNPDQGSWARLGKGAFLVHGLAVVSTIGYLLGLIFTHQYQFHYVYSHSANELPTHFMLACLWEGQEGSFLVWSFWHALLGTLVLFRVARNWRAPVMLVIASVQTILASMVLGVFLTQQTVALLLVLVLALLAWRFIQQVRTQFTHPLAGTLAALGGVIAALMVANLAMGQTGYFAALSSTIGYALELLAVLAFVGLLIYAYFQHKLPFTPWLLGVGLAAAAVVLGEVPIADWKVGSSPFVLLKDAFPNDDVYVGNPDFVPTNGTGLNPLLQNYWMVIHPPTLFLGFAATLLPFAFGLAALLKSDYKGWVKPAKPWALFSAMILGVGIIMGGYWAYETLNFGGYWNWDPVENASFVPWLTAVGGFHALLAWRTSKVRLRTSLLLLLITFVLVLYSTFLTRSGILGNTSVHSFTDLGLSGQLLLLLLAYVFGMTLLLVHRWNALPSTGKKVGFWTRETFLFSAALVLTVAAAEITLGTSLPVFNKIFGTSLAPPSSAGFFYYKWNVWFAIAFGALSGVGQFLFWRKLKGAPLSKALFRPFLTALVATVIIVALIVFSNWQFAFNERYAEAIQTAYDAGNILDLIVNGLGYAALAVADELLLAASLFAILANMDILVGLLRKSKTHWKRMGGSVAHIGFAFMLVGILFSSGYDDIISVNRFPELLSDDFQDAEDNVRVSLNETVAIDGYEVTYRGTNYPQAPVRNVEVILKEQGWVKVGFRDALNERYQVILPEAVFRLAERTQASSGEEAPVQLAANASSSASVPKEPALDTDRLIGFVESEWPYLDPRLMNERTIYYLEFTDPERPERSFVVAPETELSNGEGITPHPDRKIRLKEDIYVHISSIPKDKDFQTVMEGGKVALNRTDTLYVGDDIKIVADSVVQVRDIPGYEAVNVYRAKLAVLSGNREFTTNPTLLLDDERMSPVASQVDPLGIRVAFTGIDLNEGSPDYGKLVLDVQQRQDFVTFQAIRKPYINLLWLGTFLLTIGFGIALYRRITER